LHIPGRSKELIVTLKPTHILGQPAHFKLHQMLEKFGLNVIMIPNEDISDIFNAIKEIGSIMKCENRAAKLIVDIRDSLQVIKKNITGNKTKLQSNILPSSTSTSLSSHKNLNIDNEERSDCKDSITAILIVGREKGSLRNITVAGKNTFIGQMWQLTGGKNLYPDLPARYSIVSLESILIRNPDVIIEFDPGGLRQVKRQKITKEWKIFNNVKAIKNGNFYIVSGNHAFIPGPRLYLLAADFYRIMAGIKSKE
jgi:ABC-type Fe3+-hydroxamate transport system substrate-binding protein